MPRKPKREAEFIAWARARVNQWLGGQSGPPNIGLSVDQINQADNLVTDLEAKFLDMTNKRTAAETATGVKDTAYDNTEDYLAGLIDIIDGFAKSTKDPSVYALAGIPEPKKPASRTEAPVPTDIATRITSNGTVIFSFKVAAGGGATYPVQRRIIRLDGTTTPWQDAGLANTLKRYEDNSSQAGVAAYIYRASTRLNTGVQSEWSEWAVANLGLEPEVLAEAVAKAKQSEQPTTSEAA
ncbi:MAG: hypothetical protein RIB58_01495 [Phycisphaerales bacterium]